jgi:hypothetical protein
MHGGIARDGRLRARFERPHQQPWRQWEQKKTPTDAKRPAGVISLSGGYRGTPSPSESDISGWDNDGKAEFFPENSAGAPLVHRLGFRK